MTVRVEYTVANPLRHDGRDDALRLAISLRIAATLA